LSKCDIADRSRSSTRLLSEESERKGGAGRLSLRQAQTDSLRQAQSSTRLPSEESERKGEAGKLSLRPAFLPKNQSARAGQAGSVFDRLRLTHINFIDSPILFPVLQFIPDQNGRDSLLYPTQPQSHLRISYVSLRSRILPQ
jgi:hypothetical protein